MPRIALQSIGKRITAVLLVGMALALEFTSSCGVTDPVRTPPVRTPPPVQIVGYVAGWERWTPIDTQKVSVLNYAFAHVTNGEVVVDQDNAQRFLAALCMQRGESPWLRVLVSIGGWGADGFSDAALTDASRTRFAASVAALIKRYAVDGVDIDWEYPGLAGPGIVHREEDRENFTLLLAATRKALDALPARSYGKRRDDRYYLTAALADSQFVDHVELARVAEQLDWINLMTYDFHNSLTPTTGHHAALSASASANAGERSVQSAVDEFLAAGVPARKLVIGVPFYGRAFADVQPENHGLDQAYGHYEGEHTWRELAADFIDRNGYVRYWDASSQVPFLWNAQTRTFISYDDPQSLKIKADYVRSHHLGGLMYWEQSQDPQGELLDVLSAP